MSEAFNNPGGFPGEGAFQKILLQRAGVDDAPVRLTVSLAKNSEHNSVIISLRADVAQASGLPANTSYAVAVVWRSDATFLHLFADKVSTRVCKPSKMNKGPNGRGIFRIGVVEGLRVRPRKFVPRFYIKGGVFIEIPKDDAAPLSVAPTPKPAPRGPYNPDTSVRTEMSRISGAKR